MRQQTIKTTVDCDYLVYLGNNKTPVGFELTADERQALAIRYKSKNDYEEPTIPEQAVFVLEVFGISTTIIWLFNEESQEGELLFYKPSIIRLAKEIADNLEQCVEIMDYDPEKGKMLPIKYVPPEMDEKKKEEKDVLEEMREEHQKEIIARLPFENWLNVYWATPMWKKIWVQRKDLQEAMCAFARAHTTEVTT